MTPARPSRRDDIERPSAPDPAAVRLAGALIVERPLVVPAGRVRVPIAPGDLVRVGPGDEIEAGAAVVERLRDPSLAELPSAVVGARPTGATTAPLAGAEETSTDDLRSAGPDEPAAAAATSDGPEPSPTAGTGAASAAEPKASAPARRPAPVPADVKEIGRRRAGAAGEALFRRKDRWLVVQGNHIDAGIAPVSGRIAAVRPGRSIEIDAVGWRIPGTGVLGEVSFGPLAVARDGADGRPAGLDIGLAGAIVVLDGRVDAETITRARAMGLRGLVVGSLAGRVWRAVEASEARQRAALHPRPPFGVLVLDGELRRPIPSPLRDLLQALVGRPVGIVDDPPGLAFGGPLPAVPVAPDWVVVRAGPRAGTEGRVVGLTGPWRFSLGVQLLAARVVTEAGENLVVPVADLVRVRGTV